MVPTFYEFFAGAGLARLALEPEWRCLWANDIDARKASVYRANFGARDLTVCDVARVVPAELPGHADLAWASFPCQDLSLAGWRRGMSANRSGTFWAYWRVMRDLQEQQRRPRVIALENVVGLLYGDNFGGLCEALAGLDMQYGAVVADAQWFLPHSRPRVFVVAVDAALDCSDLSACAPQPDCPWFPRPLIRAWTGLPRELSERFRWWRLPPRKAPVAPFTGLLDENVAAGGWHSEDQTARLIAMMSPGNRAKLDQAIATRARCVGFLYKRTRAGEQRAEVRFDGVAGCLRTPQGGSSRQTILMVEEGRVRSRLLSPRETARLMGAPDTFPLPARYNDAYRAMGDGVAVPVVRWLSDSLLLDLAARSSALSTAGRAAVSEEVVRSRERAEAHAARWESGIS